jgi:ribosomal protein L19E
MRSSPVNRRSSMASVTTRVTIPATVSHEVRSNRAIVVLSPRWASHATTSSKSRECRARGRAQGTASVTTRSQRRQCNRRIRACRNSLLAPRSRCRQRRTDVS